MGREVFNRIKKCWMHNWKILPIYFDARINISSLDKINNTKLYKLLDFNNNSFNYNETEVSYMFRF